MMQRILTFLLLLAAGTVLGQQKIRLYPSEEGIVIKGFDTTAPYLVYYPSQNSSRSKTAVLICPGGGYQHLAWDKEGVKPAQFFNEKGIDAFVLLYRLNNTKQEGHRFPDQYNDVTTAMRIIRSRAEEWGIDPRKTGVMGFSAGGHLASMAATMQEKGDPNAADPLKRIDTRPAFAILLYPVITMDTSFTHKGSRNSLLGNNPEEALAAALSTENRVSPDTPPVFMALADDDKGVPPMNSVVFYEALKKNKVKASMFIYDHGGHGFGMAPQDPVLSQWPMQCVQWLKRLGFQ
jgi:acetyl esterase/lipase